MSLETSIASPAGYDAARLLALAAPFDAAGEAPALERAAARLQAYLDLDPEVAERAARRCLLLQRDRRLHESLVLQAEPNSLRSIVETVQIEGIDRLDDAGRGLLFVAFHYGPYSSLLWLALARCIAEGRLPALTFLLNRQLDANIAMPDERWAELVAHGLVSPEACVPFDRASQGVLAPRELLTVLAGGGSVLVFPDAWFVPPHARNAMQCPIGRGVVGLPRGVSWLARNTGCEVVAVRIHPAGSGHRLVLEPVADVAAALRILGSAVSSEPTPWEGWTRDQPHL